jgi:hypothetical protein
MRFGEPQTIAAVSVIHVLAKKSICNSVLIKVIWEKLRLPIVDFLAKMTILVNAHPPAGKLDHPAEPAEKFLGFP